MKRILPILVMILTILSFHGATAAAETPLPPGLAAVDKAMDNRIGGWEVSVDGRKWEPYALGRGRAETDFTLRAGLTVPAVYAAVATTGRPITLKLKVSARGRADFRVLLAEREVARFQADGSAGTATEVEREIALSPAPAGPVPLVVTVHNDGFSPARGTPWPPRRNPLRDEGLQTVLATAEWGPADAPARQAADEIRRWVTSLRIANALLHPELVRYTFTGIPYTIPDKRRVPPQQLSKLDQELNRAVAAFDAKAFAAGDLPRTLASIRASYARAAGLKKYCAEFQVHLVGNAHIDIAWLWRMMETEMVAHNTYDTVIKNMAEYPELTYAQSQAVTYDWMEKKYPALFQAMAEKIRAGRWEIVGGMWVEPDCNLINGESWVRQLLYGKRYFREKFGVDVRLGWNPDSFGYNRNMPQLYKKSGIDAFITQKIWWNDTTVFPHFIFWWQGIDDTRLLTYFPPLAYDSSLQLGEVLGGIGKYEATTGYKKSLILYGLGDHGGGPNREILDRVRGYGKLPIAPRFLHSDAAPFVQRLPAELGERIPLWQDELYLEYHQGTFTTQGAIKQNNRRCESLLNTTEKAAALAWLQGAEYPAEPLRETWKKVLTNQFHDILPGSSITAVYRDALETYAGVRRRLGRLQESALQSLCAAVDTGARPGRPLVVFNPLSWERSDLVEVTLPLDQGREYRVWDDQGREIAAENTVEAEENLLRVAFVAPAVPALGYRTFHLTAGTPAAASTVRADGPVLENDRLRITIDPASGNIGGIYDKRLQREFVAPGQQANRLQILEDRPEQWDAWNIGYTGRHWYLDRADSVELVRLTPVRAVYRVKKSFLGLAKDRYYPTEAFPSSFFTQTITVYNGLDRVDIATEADWWEDHMFLKAEFPLAVQSEQAVYEIPFAAIARTTRQETLWEKARYEVPALRWADLSDANGGLALLNDGKYGYDIHGGTMKISLLRAPTWPDPMADRGRHTFTYSIQPHHGDWAAGQTVRRAAELNQPLVAVPAAAHAGKLPPAMSFLAIDGAGVVLDGIKKAEEGDALILRFYESAGRAETVTVTLPRPVRRVMECDLQENNLRPISVSNQKISLSFGKFEIKSVRIDFVP